MQMASSPLEGSNKAHKIMLVIAIIALVLSLIAISVGLVLFFRISTLFGNVGIFEKAINEDIADQKQAVKDLEKHGARHLWYSYDEDTHTVTVYGNISAAGWIASGGIQKDEED